MSYESNPLVARIENDGFAIARHVLDGTAAVALIDALRSFEDARDKDAKRPTAYGVRHLCQRVPRVANLAQSRTIRALVQPILGDSARVVRSLLFDKTPDANWKVPWHQDLTIAVKRRRDAEGFGPWSVKDGVPHVQPPASVLARTLTLRIHLDDCGAHNGPLRVVPGSHRLGVLDVTSARQFRQERGEVACVVSAGDAVLMRPLLLHASSPALTPFHRRVIHLEFAAEELPNGLQWHE